MCTTSGCLKPCCLSNSPSHCAWATVRGNPSNTNPCEQSGRSIRSATMRSTIESGTSSPRAMIGWARWPSEVPCDTCSRSMSPVERCGAENRRASSFAWVPFPAPGGPRKITARSSFSCGRMSEVTPSSPSDYRTLAPAADPAFPCESFIVAHDQLRFQLLDGVHSDADDDQQRCATKIKVDAQAVQNPL